MQRKTLMIVGGLGALLLVLLFVVVRRSASATVPDAQTVFAGVGGVVGGGSPGTSFAPAPVTNGPADNVTPPIGGGGPSIPKGLDPRRLRNPFPTPTPPPPAASSAPPSPLEALRPLAAIMRKPLPLVDEAGHLIKGISAPVTTVLPPTSLPPVEQVVVKVGNITDHEDIAPAIKGKMDDLLNFRPPPVKTVGGL